MGMMLPDELIWIMDKLGFEWPDIDEDELHHGADLVRTFRDEVEAKIQVMDQKVNLELADALKGQAGPSYVAAWNTNRSQNLEKLLDLIGPVSTGVDVMADGVLALKIKVIADVTITLAQVVSALASSFVTFGAGAAVAAGLIIARKKALDVVMNIAVEEVLNQILPLAMEPLIDHIPAVLAAIADAPIVESVVGDPSEFYADLAALDAASEEMNAHATDIDTLTDNLLADLQSLNITGA
ncbi:MAG: hypothetical protein QM572_02130 [Nocardioides sp.]|uniref:WXG100-like domain-containing protein n=1 Tax=Nocardioides sp. TaxID=35761 RepID=UPI0039E34B65